MLAVLASCASSLMTAPQHAKTHHYALGGIGFDYPQQLEVEGGAFGEQFPSVLLDTGEAGYAMVGVTFGGDDATLRKVAIAYVRDDLLHGYEIHESFSGQLPKRRIAGHEVIGDEVVTDDDAWSITAEIYTVEVGSKRVLMIYVFTRANAEYYRPIFDVITNSLNVDDGAR